MKLKFVKNSNKFRPAAITFHKLGRYTAAPEGTTEFFKFWDEEMKRCVDGYEADDGDYITGYNYFYLNYSPILLVKEKERKLKSGAIAKRMERVRDFPRFWDGDRAYFDAIELAEEQGQHLAVLKARGRGYSFKAASMLCRNFFLIPDSKNYAVASENEFLTKDGILTKAWDIIDFVNEHTA